MKITIGEKVYFANKYTPAMVLKADELLIFGTKVSLGEEQKFIDEVIPFIAQDVFKGQFTANDFLNEYESETVLFDLLGMLGAIRGTVMKAMAQFPAESGEAEKNADRSSLKNDRL